MKKLLLFLVLFLAACRPSPVKVLVFLPANGSMDAVGNGIALAAERINSEGGVFGHTVRVTRGNGVSAAGMDGVSVVMVATGNRKELEAIHRLASRRRVPVVLANPLFGGEGVPGNEVSFARGAEEEALFMGDFCAFTLHASQVLILKGDGTLAESFRKGFSRDNRLASDYQVTPADPGEDASKIKTILDGSDPPQAVFWASQERMPPEIMSMLSGELKGRALLVTAASFMSGGGGFPGGTLTPLPYYDGSRKSVEVVAFRVDYKERFGRQPSSWAAVGYEAMTAVKQGFESGARKDAEFRNYFKNREVNFALLGRLNFTTESRLVVPFDMAMVKGSEAVPIREMAREALVELQEKTLSFRYGKKNGKNTDPR